MKNKSILDRKKMTSQKVQKHCGCRGDPPHTHLCIARLSFSPHYNSIPVFLAPHNFYRRLRRERLDRLRREERRRDFERSHTRGCGRDARLDRERLRDFVSEREGRLLSAGRTHLSPGRFFSGDDELLDAPEDKTNAKRFCISSSST